MRLAKILLVNLGVMAITVLSMVNQVEAAGFVKLSGTRFNMEVPATWTPAYKDIDNKLLMIYFTKPKTDTALEGVYLRKVQDASFSMTDFKKWRIGAESKRYAGKDFKVTKEGELKICGSKGNFLETSWKDNGKTYIKYTAQCLKDGGQYLVVLHGVKGKVNKKVFDHAVKTFAVSVGK